MDEADASLHPPELLNTLTPGDPPPHKLRLRNGMPIMLIRNLDQLNGKANGTLTEILEITRNVFKAKILDGSSDHVGATIFIARIKLISHVCSPAIPACAASICDKDCVCHDHQQGSRPNPDTHGPLPASTSVFTWTTVCGIVVRW